jgi:hypothetical protein
MSATLAKALRMGGPKERGSWSGEEFVALQQMEHIFGGLFEE